ncbi:hypothetical protein EV421DRAFT_1741508 [Armillaria borealis]|uniref:Uncharacterized protein n=1 Tax=Armillaria borealis TaxID=47425 RepID=A0AA39IZT1_9AGAR|nr:hypothetical protein EV421DRAFT_1741508 [Armillaria borealis]
MKATTQDRACAAERRSLLCSKITKLSPRERKQGYETSCIVIRLDCTYIESIKSAPSKRDIRSLDDKVEKMENLLRKILPTEADLKEELEGVRSQRMPRECYLPWYTPGPRRTRYGEPCPFTREKPRGIRRICPGLSVSWGVKLSSKKRWMSKRSNQEHFHFIPTRVLGILFVEPSPPQGMNLRFPPGGLIPTLIDAYSMYLDDFFLIFHRSTSLKEGLHYRKHQFGGTVHSGPKYIPLSLYELKMEVTASLQILLGFLTTASVLDIGGHWSANRAQCRCLLGIDSTLSSALGRSIEIDVPTECDDEYWVHPDPQQAFKRPLGKPSTVSFLNFTSGTADYGMYAYYHEKDAARNGVAWLGGNESTIKACGSGCAMLLDVLLNNYIAHYLLFITPIVLAIDSRYNQSQERATSF